MSLYSAMRAGVSGLFAQSQSMAMISDNIANISTNGYKLVRASFSSLITVQGTNGAYTAGSVRALPKRSIDVAGSLTSSNNPLDLSVVGEGFFAITDRLQAPTGAGGRGQYYTPGGETLFTRDGGFRRDANGNLKNANGHFLLGWPVLGTDSVGNTEFDRTNLPSTLTAVSVQTTTGRPQPSKNLTLNANLDSKLITKATQTLAAGGTPESFSVTMNIYDRQGTLHTLRVRFTPARTPTGGVGYQVDPADPASVESYAYEVTMEFEGTNNPPKFRNGSGKSSSFYAAFDSVGNFKSFYQPIAGYNSVNGRNADGTYTGLGAAVTGSFITADHIPPLPDDTGFAVEEVQLSEADTSQNERWLDLGLGQTQAGVAPVAGDYIGQGTVAGGFERPDLRIIGDAKKAGVLNFDIDKTAPLGPPNPATPVDQQRSYGQSIVFDIDFSGNAQFDFHGTRTAGVPDYGDDVQIRLNFGAVGTQNGLTHYNAPSSITNITQDGFTIGQLEGVQVSEEGYVTAVYDNGDRKDIAQVPVVSFNSPNNLEVANGNAFRETQDSGQAVVRFPGTSGVGNLAPSTLETSNVDIAEEFTHMIITQRAYSANTKIITTADEMLDELIRAKR